MKMNRLISIALVAIMALTVVSAAGVLAAPTAAAAPKTQGPIVITYEAGKTVTIMPKQFNYDSTTKLVGEEGKAPILQTFSTGGTAFTLAKMTKAGSWASAYARVGAEVSVTGAPSGDVPVTVTVNGKYILSMGKLGRQRTFIRVGVDQRGCYIWHRQPSRQDKHL